MPKTAQAQVLSRKTQCSRAMTMHTVASMRSSCGHDKREPKSCVASHGVTGCANVRRRSEQENASMVSQDRRVRERGKERTPYTCTTTKKRMKIPGLRMKPQGQVQQLYRQQSPAHVILTNSSTFFPMQPPPPKQAQNRCHRVSRHLTWN